MAFAVPATTVFVDAIRSGVVPSLISVACAAIMFLWISISSWHRGSPIAAEIKPPTSAEFRALALDKLHRVRFTKRQGALLNGFLSRAFAGVLLKNHDQIVQ
jgi:hypothetical protein